MHVLTAAQAAAADTAAIAAGTPSATLMMRAAAASVSALHRHASDRIGAGVAVFAGTGNNGGDAWIIADLLRQDGAVVRVHSTGEPTTDDARVARDRALQSGAFDAPRGDEGVLIDGILGTGARGAPRSGVLGALSAMRAISRQGAFALAVDIPSAIDATTGHADEAVVRADLTVTFGTLKRAHTIARSLCGRVEVVDIGLGVHADADVSAPTLIDPHAVGASVPRITATAHKGTRGRMAIVGGQRGMAGAVILAARGALRSGAGLVRVVVAPESLSSLQSAVPEATAADWPVRNDDVSAALGIPGAIVIGPGIGASQRPLVERVLGASSVPVVLDADALNAYAGDLAALRAALGAQRVAVLTPHPAECARLMGVQTGDVLRDRFEIGSRLAHATGAVVVLKGTPTVVSAPDGRVTVAPVGSPVLATGGSGDVLSGVLGALLATMPDAFAAALAAVWAHGTAAERVASTRVRGATLADVVDALAAVWHEPARSFPSGVLAVLSAVGE